MEEMTDFHVHWLPEGLGFESTQLWLCLQQVEDKVEKTGFCTAVQHTDTRGNILCAIWAQLPKLSCPRF